jgi:hypothetical protein
MNVDQSQTLVGRTIIAASYEDQYERGLCLVLDNGNIVRVRELMQAGAIKVTLNGNEIERDYRDED